MSSERRKILPWVLAGTAAVQLTLFFAAIVLLLKNTGSMDNKFRDVAVQNFLGYMALVNVNLLIGYLLVALPLVLMAYPAVKFMLRSKKAVTPWMVMWRSMIIGFGFWLYFTLRYYYIRPNYFSQDVVLSAIWTHSIGWLADSVKAAIFTKGPWVLAAVVIIYYIRLCVRSLFSGNGRLSVKSAALAAFAVIVAGSLGVFALHDRTGAVEKKDTRPNIIMLVSDSLRADHLSVNGYKRKTSPAIDELSSRSINFQKCFTPISSTLESMTSIMTGQYPHTHGLRHMFPNKKQVEYVKNNSPALAWQLRQAGYDTSVMGDWCAGAFDLMPMGFEEIDVAHFDNFKIYMTQAVYQEHIILPLFFDNSLGYKIFPKLKACAYFVTPDMVTDQLKKRLTEKSKSGRPFFITAFYSITHLPYSINPPYSKKFTDPNYKGPHKETMQFSVDKFIGSVNIADKWKELPKEDVDQIIGLYDGCINKFDDTVNDVVNHLKKTGLDKNTVIVITSDHGDDLFEPNTTFGHGLTFNGGDHNNNIPLIIHVPGLENRPAKINKIVRSIDIAPTLLDLAGVKPDPRMDGSSLKPYLTRADADLSLPFFGETSYLFYKRYIPGEEPLFIPPMDSTTTVDPNFDFHFVLKDKFQAMILETKERVLRTERWKLVFTPGKHKDIWRLYDTKNDPYCERPVNRQHLEVYAAMQPELQAWMNDKKESRVSDIFPSGE